MAWSSAARAHSLPDALGAGWKSAMKSSAKYRSARRMASLLDESSAGDHVVMIVAALRASRCCSWR